MIIDFEEDLKAPVKKHNLYNVADRSAQLIAVKSLYKKPILINSFSFKNLCLIKDRLLMNYLLTKLEFINKFKYIEYMYHLKRLRDLNQINFLNIPKYIVNDVRIYNILYNKKSFNINIEWSESILSSPMVSVINKFNFYLKPLVYEAISDEELKALNSPSDIIEYADIVLAKEADDFDYLFNNNIPIKKESIYFDQLPSKSEMTYLKYLHQEEAAFKYYTPLPEKFDKTDLIFEEFLSLHINFENHNTMYLLIDINHYTLILNNLSLPLNQINFYLKLANQYNEIINKFVKIKNIEYFTFKDLQINPHINCSISEAKKIELSNSLNEFNIYTEYSLKTIIEFIELFLFKFEFVFTVSIDKLLDLFYKGIESQIFFFDFYNLLIGELSKLKYNMTFATMSYIIEFLEFFFLLADIGGFTPEFFERPIYTILNHVYFKNLRLFRFNFYTKLKHFKYNNSIQLNNYYKYKKYINKLLNPVIFNLEINSKDEEFLNSNTAFVKNSNISQPIQFHIKKLVKLFSYFDKTIYYKYKISKFKTYVRKRSDKVKFTLILPLQYKYIKSIFRKLYAITYKFRRLSFGLPLSDLPIFKYVNLYRLKEIILFKDLLKRYLSKNNKHKLKNNINNLKSEIIAISVQMNQIRLSFLKSIISYNTNNKNKPLFLDNINFYNLAPGIQPSSQDSLISNLNKINREWVKQSKVLLSLSNNLDTEPKNDKK
jgi:hypothetical protein